MTRHLDPNPHIETLSGQSVSEPVQSGGLAVSTSADQNQL